MSAIIEKGTKSRVTYALYGLGITAVVGVIGLAGVAACSTGQNNSNAKCEQLVSAISRTFLEESPAFLHNIPICGNIGQAQSWFRKESLRYHPDRWVNAPAPVKENQMRKFIICGQIRDILIGDVKGCFATLFALIRSA